MHIELLPIMGKYRGVTRYFTLPKNMSLKQYHALAETYDKYLEWHSKQDDTYHPWVYKLLSELCTKVNNFGDKYEIICFSDVQKEFEIGHGFLGFDVFGDFRCSALEEGNRIGNYYANKLNSYGLFSNYEDAKEFCCFWKKLMISDENPWEVEENPRPFCVWLCQR